MSAVASGGRSHFAGGRVDGFNGSLLFVPALRFGGSFSVLPIMTADYQRSRDVQELAGGGFVTHAQHSRGGTLKAVQSLGGGGFKAKVHGTYKQQFIQDAQDEPWGEGAFDHHKAGGGLEAAWEGDGLLVKEWSAGVDYYKTTFSNYVDNAERVNLDVQEHLDFSAVDLPLSGRFSVAGNAVTLSGLASFRRFDHSPLQKDDGTRDLSSHRRDFFWQTSVSATRALPTLPFLGGPLEFLAEGSASYARLGSNQNSYNVSALAFYKDFYSYGETTAGPTLFLRHRRKLSLSVGYSLAARTYDGRPAQDSLGADKGRTISSITQTLRWTLSYPLGQGFSARLSGASQHAGSNMKNESTYRYNYNSSHVFLGVAWEI